MATFNVCFANNGTVENTQIVADGWEENERGDLVFYRHPERSDREVVAYFKLWAAVVNLEHRP